MPDVMRQPAPRETLTVSPSMTAPPAGEQASASRDSVPRLASAQLFGQSSEVHIEHGDAVYRLRITSLGKLILTK